MQNDLMKVIEVGELAVITRRDESGQEVPVGTFENGEPAVKRTLVVRTHSCATSPNTGPYLGFQQVTAQLLGTQAEECSLQAGQWIVGTLLFFARPGSRGWFQDIRLTRYCKVEMEKL